MHRRRKRPPDRSGRIAGSFASARPWSNIGEGDFVLRATRAGDGATGRSSRTSPTRRAARRCVPTREQARLGRGRPQPLARRAHRDQTGSCRSTRTGSPVANRTGVADAKVGFCFYDFSQCLDDRTARQPVYSHESCGKQRRRRGRHGPLVRVDRHVRLVALPGQIHRRDGPPRREATAYGSTSTQRGWFREATPGQQRQLGRLRARHEGERVAGAAGDQKTARPSESPDPPVVRRER